MRRHSPVTVSGIITVTFLGVLQALPVAAEPNFVEHNFVFPPVPPRSQTLMFHVVDINGDGVDDLSFRHQPLFGTGLNLGSSENTVSGLNGAQVVTDGTFFGGPRADARAPGELISPALTWTDHALIFYDYDAPENRGDPVFLNPDASLGVRFTANGQTHYGWVGVHYVPGILLRSFSKLVIDDFAWETV